MLTASWIILTMGDRPDALSRAIASIRTQQGPAAELIIVGNGADPGPIGDATVVELEENEGIPGGRNHGAGAATGEILFFLDDDAACADDRLQSLVLDLFDERDDLGVVAMRISDPDTGTTQRRHVPRLRASDPGRPGDVTTFLGGACAIRADVFVAAGGYPEEFRYAMEETDLGWRILDRGWAIHYFPLAQVHHPATEPARHGHAFVTTARNRVWVACRRLPRVLVPIYLTIWTLLMLLRAPSWIARRETIAGLVSGIRQVTPPPIERMSWSTVLRMARAGRPPII